MKPTCSDLILASVEDGIFLPVHEMQAWMKERGHFFSESAISARQRELAQEGKIVGFRPKGKPYKVWGKPGQGILVK